MAKKHGKDAGLLLDGFDLGAVASASTLGISIETAEVTTFSSLAKEYLEGNAGFTGSFSSFMDTGTDRWNHVAFSKLTTQDDDHYACWEAPTSGAAHTAGNVVYEGIVRWTGQPREFSMTDAIMLNGDWQGTDALARGEVNYSGTVTATGVKTGRNMGATVANTKLVATFRLLAVSGSGSVTLRINESSDDGGGDAYAAITGLTSGAMTTVGTCVRATTVAATEAWKQVECTAYSGFTSVTVLVTLATAHA